MAEADAQAMVSEIGTETVIDITPHHGAMTRAGKANFNRFSDGSAEFIDNSLQAYKSVAGVDSRDILMRIFLNRDLAGAGNFTNVKNDDLASYMVVADYGSGMDDNDLKDFATYSLDRETRKKTSDPFISKFGVGAKQSGFFLGEKIRVITRKSSGNVLELVLDEAEFEERRLGGKKVFTAAIKRRHANNEALRSQFIPEDEKLDEDMQKFVSGCEHRSNPNGSDKDGLAREHFTIIIIKLKEDIVRGLYISGRYRETPYELAQIYHFHLHPDDLPQKLIERSKFQNRKLQKNDREQIISEMAQPVTERSGLDRGSDSSTDAKLNIYFAVVENGEMITSELNLRDFQDDEVSEHIEKAKAIFRFNMSFTDPANEVIGEINAAANIDRILDTKCTVQGMLFYYPHEGDNETRPVNRERKVASSRYDEGNVIIRAAPTYTGQNDEEDIDEVDIGTFETEKSGSLFHNLDIYWVNRLVPQSFFTSIPLFPKNLTTPAQCEKEGIPHGWRNRLKGYIFFNHKWENISNNKLKIQVDPDIDTYLNKRCDLRGGVTFKPLQSQTKFRTWLKACHDEFDRETHFQDRLQPIENICSSFSKRDGNILCKDAAPFTSVLFRHLHIGSSVNKMTLRVGDNVKLFINPNNTISTRTFIYAKIVGFDIPENESLAGAVDHYGRGRVRYLRLPVALYQPRRSDSDKILDKSVQDQLSAFSKSGIFAGVGMSPNLRVNGNVNSSKEVLDILPEHFFANKPVPIQAIKFDDCKVSEADINRLIDDAPDHLKICLVEDAGKKPRDMVKTGSHAVKIGKEYYKIGVEILTRNKKPCYMKPQTRKTSANSDRYKISVMIFRKKIKGVWKDMKKPIKIGETSDYTYFSQQEGKDIQTNQPWDNPKSSKGASLGLFGIAFHESGAFQARCDVFDGDAKILSQNFGLIVKTEKLHHANVRFENSDAIAMMYRIDDALPKMFVDFKDRSGNSYLFDHAIPVLFHITAEQIPAIVAVANKDDDDKVIEFVEKPIYNVDDSEPFLLEDFFVTEKNKKAMKPIMSTSKPTDEFQIKYSISVFIDPSFDQEGAGTPSSLEVAYTEQLGESFDFSLSYRPSEVCSIKHKKDAKSIDVPNYEALPSIRLACHDRWGHSTTTFQPSETWRVVLVKNDYVVGNSSADEYSIVDAEGIATFSHLKAEYGATINPANIIKTELKFRVEIHRGEEKRFIPPSSNRTGDSLVQIPISILPNDSGPAAVQILYNGNVLLEDYESCVGEKLTNLSFRVLNGKGEPFEEASNKFSKGKGSGVTVWTEAVAEVRGCKWTSKGTFLKLSGIDDGVFSLPDIDLPRVSGRFEYEVRLKLSAGKNQVLDLEAHSFVVTVNPAEAIGWNIVTNLDQSLDIMIGEANSLRNIRALILQDIHENSVSWMKETHNVPKLLIHYKNPKGTKSALSKRNRIEKNVSNKKQKRSTKKVAESDTSSDEDKIPNEDLSDNDANEDEIPDPQVLEDGTLCLELVEGFYLKRSDGSSKIVESSKLSELDKSEQEKISKEAVSCFLLPTDSTQVIKLPSNHMVNPPMPIWLELRSSSPDDLLSGKVLRGNLVNGLISKVILESEDLCIGRVSKALVDVNLLTDVELIVHLADSSGIWDGRLPENVSSSKKVKPSFTIEEVSTGAQLFSMKQRDLKFIVPFRMSSIKEKLSQAVGGLTEDGKPFDFELKCVYRYDSKRVCEPAYLRCCITKLHLVNELKILSSRVTENEEATQDMEDYEYSCSEPLPSLRLITVTDNAVEYIPQLSSMEFTIALQGLNSQETKSSTEKNKNKSSSKKSAAALLQTLRMQDYYEDAICESGDSGGIILTPKSLNADTSNGKRKADTDIPISQQRKTSLPIGKYRITAQYTEARKHLMSKLSETQLTKTSSISFVVKPGPPETLIIQDIDRLFANATATNSKNQSRLIVEEPVYINCYDNFGNKTVFPSNCEIFASIRSPLGKKQKDLPALEDAPHGYVIGESRQSNDSEDIDTFVFPRLELLPDVGSGGTSNLNLVFSYNAPTNIIMQSQSNAPMLEIAEVITKFEFLTDSALASRHKKLAKQIEPLQARVSSFNSEMAEWKQTKDEVLVELKHEMQNFKQMNIPNSYLKPTLESPPKLKYDRLESVKKCLMTEMKLFEKPNRAARKTLKSLPREAEYIGENCLGLTVDLGYVDDESESRIISDAAGSYITSVICNDDGTAKRLYEKKVKAWSVERMRTFKKPDGSLRNNAEIEQQALPLPKISGSGNPRYVVNMIQLEKENEYLRDKLFFSIFDRTLLFDDRESALAYQKKMFDLGQRPPTLLTMKGDKFRGDGLFDPSLQVLKEPQVMFGEQPYQKREDYTNFKVEVETTDNLMRLVYRRDEAAQKIEEFDGMQADIDSDIARIDELESERAKCC